jgi:antitoxin component YwqK of YwqJK toxin-antitoxin module
VVTEYERTKYNTPPDMSNCFQTHKLKYVKENADTEMIIGSWVPAPNQSGNCGYGRTSLARRTVKRTTANEQQAYVPPVKKPVPQRQSIAKQNKPATKDQIKTKVTSRPPLVKNNSELNSNTSTKNDTLKQDISITKLPGKKEDRTLTSNIKFDQRINTVLKTIPIKNETFTVDFYDNGEIDGDSISVFYNGKLVLSHKRLTDKPITLTLTIDPDKEINELVMYAENLGEIPPNTALMIVNDRDNRYEARITSDTQKNGTIRFTYKPNVP